MKKIKSLFWTIFIIFLLSISSSLLAKGIFKDEVTEGSPAQFSLVDFIDMSYYKSLAISDGIYLVSPINLNLSLFNLCREDDGTPGGEPGDGIQQALEDDEPDGISGVFDTGPPTFSGMSLPSDFNGIIYSEDDIFLFGTLCERSLTIVSNDNIIVTDSIYTCPNRGCECQYVNLLLMCQNTFHISQFAPKVLHIDAGIISRTSNWRAVDYMDTTDADDSHPDGKNIGPFSMDLDRDGLIGGYLYSGTEDPAGKYNIDHWNEINVVDQTNGYDVWDLEITGAIITQTAGSASPWSTFASSMYGGKQTRYYNDDADVVLCKPPETPHAGKWRKVSWNEEIIR